MFAHVISLARRYTETLRPPRESGDVEVASEVVLRLRQLHWLYDRIHKLETTLLADFERVHGPAKSGETVLLAFLNRHIPNEADVPFQPQEELRLFGESFYHCAHRILVILDQCQYLLPGLKPIEARGIRRVRNNLIEHANKQGGHAYYSFSVSNAAGLRLRTISRAEDPDAHLDEGIHANARELVAQLEKVFESMSGRGDS